MSWAGAIATVHSHLVTAGAAVSPKFERVQHSEPFTSIDRIIAYWYDGDQDSETGGQTLAKNNIQERLVIRAYIPVASRDPDYGAAADNTLQAVNRAIQAELLGDAHLADNTIGIQIQQTQTGWQQQGTDAWLRVLTIPVWLDFAWTEDVSI